MFRIPAAHGIINRMGFNNGGVDAFVANVQSSRFYQNREGVLGLNIGKNADTPIERAVDDYLHCLEKVYPYASYVTVNISSPNTKNLRQLQGEVVLRGGVAGFGGLAVPVRRFAEVLCDAQALVVAQDFQIGRAHV